MRTTVAIFVCLLSIAVGVSPAQTTANMTPDALLERGLASYRAARYAEAAKDLNAAAQALLSSEQMQSYVNSGKFPNIEKFETALVYLTLAEVKLGREDQAREAVLRLMTAERIENVYPRLGLPADAAEFPAIAARLVPGTTLTPAKPQVAATAPPPPPKPVPAQPPTPVEKPAPVAAAPKPVPTPAPAPAPVVVERPERRVETRRDYLVQLRQADAYADNGQLSRANDMYTAIANAADAPRDIVAEAAVGLYKTSAFAGALDVLKRLMPFGRGEEDLRYYNAVALYETGDYAAAKRELACALPFIEVNDDVARYRAKIEQTR